MFSIKWLVTSSVVLTIIGVTYANVVKREAAKIQVTDLDMRGLQQKCSGYGIIWNEYYNISTEYYSVEQQIYLSQGQEVVIQSAGYESGKFIEGCMVC